MKNTIRNMMIAAPLAVSAITLAPAAAMASEPGPVIVLPPAQPDPQPNDQKLAPAPKPTEPKGPGNIAPAPKPSKPKGPGDIAPAPKPTGPKGPGDISDAPKPNDPKGPGDITNPAPCPTHGVDCTPDKDDEPTGGNGGGSTEDVDSLAVPTRIDAGLASQDSGNGMELTWLLAGGAMVTATGGAFVARHKLRRTA